MSKNQGTQKSSDGVTHNHMAGHAGHDHSVPKSQKHLLFALAITFGYAFIELVGGIWSGSLALISDAGHMMTDSAALLLAFIANVVGQRAANASKTYGYARAELIGALVNSLTMILLVVWIIVEAVQRIQAPVPVNGLGVMVIAVIGLLVNLVSAWQLSNDHDNLNSRGALIHVMGDLLGSVAAIVAGAVVYFTGWSPIDPILSVAVALLILRSTWILLKRSLHLLMDGVPENINFQQLKQDISWLDNIVEVHDLHVWNLGGKRNALSAHLVITEPNAWSSIIISVTTMLQEKYQIDHVTIQPAWQGQNGQENVPIIRPEH